MARTASTDIKIRNNGVPLGAGGFSVIDFVSGLTGSDSGLGVVGISTSAAAGSNIATEVIASTTSGANVTLDLTTLAHPFVAVEVVFRNGQNITPITDWSRSGSTVTVLNATTADVYQIQYTW